MSKQREYERTVNGFLMRLYHNMKCRVTGVQKKYAHLYLGLEILDKEDFYRWSRHNSDFLALYKNWVINGYDQKLTPSVNRINPKKGYTLDNIEWVTNSMNSALARVTKRNLDKEKQAIYKSVGVKNEK